MKKARIVVPAGAALIVGSCLLLVLWSQVQSSAQTLQQKLRANVVPSSQSPDTVDTLSDTTADGGDEVLVHMRQGDLDALQGNWADAEKEYQQAVRQQGGIPALRKLAQAQLQRREMNAVSSTINALKQAGAQSEDLLLLQVIVNLREGALDKAKTLLDQAAESPQKHYGLALLSIVQEQHTAAKAELELVVNGWEPVLRDNARTLQSAYDEFALFPANNQAHLETLLGRALAQVQECELALPLVSHAIGSEQDYRDAWIVQGFCQMITERFTDARGSLERAYALDPEKPETQYFLGRTYAALKDHTNAITFLGYALKNGFMPQTEARKTLAREAVEAGDGPLALEQYQSLIQEKDVDRSIFTQYVPLAIMLNQNDQAYTAAQAAVQKWPDNAAMQILLGQAAASLGKKEEATAAFQKALQLDPGNAQAKEGLKKL